MPKLELERPRDLWQIIGTCMSLYTGHFLLFATLSAVIVVPVDLAVYGVAGGQLWSSYHHATPLFVAIAGPAIAGLIMSPMISANHARAVVTLGEGATPAIGQTLIEATHIFPTVVVVLLLAGLGIFFGLLLLIVPGIYLSIRWYVVAQAAAVERLHGKHALRRSGELVEGSWWRVFGISIALTLVVAAASGVITVPVVVIAKATDSQLVRLLGRMLIDTITYSFAALSATLLFFDLRFRHSWGKREPA